MQVNNFARSRFLPHKTNLLPTFCYRTRINSTAHYVDTGHDKEAELYYLHSSYA